MLFGVFQVFRYFRLPEVAAISPMVTFAGPGDVNRHARRLIIAGRSICGGRLFINRIVVSRVSSFFLASGIDDESKKDPKDQGDK